MVPPGFSLPSASAASLMVRAGRSLSEPDGLALSSLRNRRQSPRSMRVTSIRGVSPMRSRIDAMCRAAAVLPTDPAGFLLGLIPPADISDRRMSNLTYWAAKGLTFDPVRLCSARNGSIETFDLPPAQPQSLYRHPARACSGIDSRFYAFYPTRLIRQGSRRD